jgi:two-component system phosphate regulon sensor histidine kinase PhoR
VKMRRRLLLTYLLVAAAGLAAAMLLAAPLIQRQYKTEFGRRLDTALSLMTEQPQELLRDPQAFAQREQSALWAAGVPFRVTVVAEDGAVLGDSGAEGETAEIPLENHLERPEIIGARQNGRGYDIRRSESTGVRYYYAADYLPGVGFVRAALPMTELDRAMNALWWCLAVGLAAGAAAACLVAVFTSRGLSRPLSRLTSATQKIAAGDFDSRVPEERGDEVGELARSFNRMADTTAHAFRALQQEEGRLRAVLQGMDDGVLAADKENRVLLLNARAKDLLSAETLQEGDLLGGSLLQNELLTLIRQASQENGVVHGVMQAGAPERTINVYAAPLPAAEAGGAALAVLTDVTEMRRLQQLRSEFVANVTHELKTPLTSIRGFIELLQSGDRDEETRRYFYEVLDIETERLRSLIDDMLVLSQIENAKEDPAAQRCDLSQELGRTVERMLPIAEKAGVSLQWEAEEVLPVSASASRLQQLFGNLIDNAVKYNRPGGKVTVTARRQRNVAVVRVEDTGIGIPPEHLPRLFERFYRVDTSRSREVGGTGLGLAIVKHIAGLYRGDVSVESTPGEGSVFTVRLPLA